MISGASGFTVVELAATVRVAGVLVTVPDALVTVTVKTEPLSVLAVAGVV
jgi:Tfp pilus assembly protein PilE